MIKIVRGNDFKLKIPVEVQTGTDSSGNPIVSNFDFKEADVSVNIINVYSRIPFVHTVEGNVIIVPISGIGNGSYDVEILVRKEGNMRSLKRGQFKIVESNEESDLSAPVEFDIEVHQLDAHVLIDFSNNTETGVTDYNQLGNKPSINKVVLSGNKTLDQLGIQSKGDYITDPKYVHTDSNFTIELKRKVESLNNYDDTTIQTAVIKLEQSLNKLLNGDVNGVIDTFNEIEAFLSGITESDSLTRMLSDLRTEILKGIPTKVSQLTNDSKLVNEEYVNTQINGLTTLIGDFSDVD